MPRGKSSSSHPHLTRLFVPEEIASSPAPLPPPPTKLPKLSNSITRSGRCIRSLHTRPLILHSSPHLSFITFPSLMGWAAFGRLDRLSTLALACLLAASPLLSLVHSSTPSKQHTPRPPFEALTARLLRRFFQLQWLYALPALWCSAPPFVRDKTMYF